jgi:hypothetical protein
LAYADNTTLAASSTFQGSVQGAATAYSNTVTAEDPTLYNHKNRLSHAHRFLTHPQTVVVGLANAVAGQSGITSGSSDANILTAVGAVWNAVAGTQ